MDVKTIMTKTESYSKRAKEGLGRITDLIDGLERTRINIASIEEADTYEALEGAYKKLEEAFLTCIDSEQDRIWSEVK